MNNTQNKGITLIALIITIIVLLILAGITLNMLLGDNGIIKRAGEAVDEYESKSIEENKILLEAEQIKENLIGQIRKDNNEDNEEDNNTPEPPEIGDIVEVPEGSDWDIDKVNPTVVDEDENIIPIPKELEYKEGTKDTGVVVIDPDTLNEFVWVPTDEIEYKRDNFIKSTVTKDQCTEPDYNSAYTTSVEKYGGFFIARYEAGIDSPRTVSGTASTPPIFQKNKYPYNFVTWQQAKDLSVGLYSGSENIISDLINSYAWDTTLRRIESTNQDKDADNNSTNWGNYRDKIYTITGWYSTNDGATYTNGTYTKPNQSTRVLLGTGILEDGEANNIYDLAGNVWEWTIEKYSNNRVLRGGSCYDVFNQYATTGYRISQVSTHSVYNVGFRLQLYVAL